MKEKIKEYIEQESLLDKTITEIKSKREEFEKTLQTLLAIKAEQETKIAELKLPIIEEAKKEFKETGLKKLYGGIGIKENSVLTYDLVKASDWAKEKQMFIVFDQKAFEKAAMNLNLDWVTSSKEPTVTFPKEWKLED